MDVYESYPDLLDPAFIEKYDFSECWTVNNPDGAMSDLDVGVALIRFRGNFSKVAEVLKCSRRRVSGFVARNEALRYLAEDLGEEFLDAVEESFMTTALAGDPLAIKFFLSTKGRNRGFAQRSEVTGANGGPVQVEEVSAREIIESRIASLASRVRTPSDPEQSD